MVGSGRVDVHGVDIESVRYLAGSLHSDHEASSVSEYDDDETSQTAGGGSVGDQLSHMFSSADRLAK